MKEKVLTTFIDTQVNAVPDFRCRDKTIFYEDAAVEPNLRSDTISQFTIDESGNKQEIRVVVVSGHRLTNYGDLHSDADHATRMPFELLPIGCHFLNVGYHDQDFDPYMGFVLQKLSRKRALTNTGQVIKISKGRYVQPLSAVVTLGRAIEFDPKDLSEFPKSST